MKVDVDIMTPQELAEIAHLAGSADYLAPMAFGPQDGISKFGHDLAAWAPALLSADAEILPHKGGLDARSRDLQRNDGYVQWARNLHQDSIVGSMYTLNSKPLFKALGRSPEWAEEFQEEVETLFTLYAESPMKWIDAAGTNDFTSMLRLGVGVYFQGGEVLTTGEYSRSSQRDFRTMFQMVDCDRLTTPYTYLNDRNTRGGITHDKFGNPLFAHIKVAHPTDYLRLVGDQWWRTVPFRKPWGRQQVFFIREQQRIDQTRAVSDIVAGLKEIAITRRFRDVVLQNAVVSALYAATIESELPSQAVFEQLGANQGTAGAGVVGYAEEYLGAVASYAGASKNLMIDGARIPHLFPGTKLNLHAAGSPGGVGQDFEKSMLRYLSATLNVSYEELSRDFSDANYASMKGGIAITRRFMKSRKRMVVDNLANGMYRNWLEEAINNDKLTTFRKSEAPILYTNDYLNLMFDALANADWIGASEGMIDELKETQAAVLRLKTGLSTYEDELARQGKDWRRVIPQLGRERKLMIAEGVTVEEDNGVNAASGTPSEAEDPSPSKKKAAAQ